MGSAGDTAKDRISREGRLGWGGLILGLYFALLALAFAAPARPDQRRAAAYALALAENAELRLGELLGGLRPVAARLRSGEAMDWKEFDGLFAGKTGPTLTLIAWAPRVPHDERASFEAEAGRDAYRSLNVFSWSAHGKRTMPATNRDLFPLTFGHPHPKADALLGWDLASEPALKTAIQEAGRTRAPQIVVRAAPSAGQGAVPCTPLATAPPAGICEPHLILVLPVERSRRAVPLKGVLLGAFPLSTLAQGLFDPSAEGQLLSSVDITKGARRRARLADLELGIGRATFTWAGIPWTLELHLPPTPGLATRLLRR